MFDHPSTNELIKAVKGFIDDTAAPQLEGHAKFHARVASNVLAIVLRELETRPSAEAEEVSRLQDLLNNQQILDPIELNRSLCDAIRTGDITRDTPDLLAHLKTTAIAQLVIDQPNYSGLKKAVDPSE